MIAKAPDKMRHTPMRLDAKGRRKPVRRCKVVHRPKHYRPKIAGELVGLETIERRMGQVKRYIMTYIDESTGYAIAFAMDKLTSANAQRFFNKAFALSPFPVSQVITDNGSEFKGKFSELLDEAEIKHYHTYPNTPKMNAVCERFNRTLQEQFVDYHEDLLFTDLKTLTKDRIPRWVKCHQEKRYKTEFLLKITPKNGRITQTLKKRIFDFILSIPLEELNEASFLLYSLDLEIFDLSQTNDDFVEQLENHLIKLEDGNTLGSDVHDFSSKLTYLCNEKKLEKC